MSAPPFTNAIGKPHRSESFYKSHVMAKMSHIFFLHGPFGHPVYSIFFYHVMLDMNIGLAVTEGLVYTFSSAINSLL